MISLAIDDINNDLIVDDKGNLASASASLSLAIAAACAIRTFQGEVYYDTLQGIPYLTTILGKNPPIEYLRGLLVTAALGSDPDIVAANAFFTSLTDRTLNGQVQVSDSTGNVAVSDF